MKTIRDMYNMLATIDSDGVASFEVVKFRVSEKDGLAGKLLVWMLDNMTDGLTVGEVMEIIDNAKFWLMFIQATAEKVQETK